MRKNGLVKVLGVAVLLLILTYSLFTKSQDRAPYNEDPDVISGWLKEWGKANVKDSSGNYVLYHFTDRMYVVTSPLKWKPNDPKSHIEPIEVPKGFVTDFASVPRLFWAAYPPEGAYGFPSVFHDYLYWTQTVTRKEADRIFKIMMDEFEVGRISSATIHSAVRAAGGFAWKKNRKDCVDGERRLLVLTPEEEPNTKWDDWKLQPDVFGESICLSP